jgi:acetyl esterase/lipase
VHKLHIPPSFVALFDDIAQDWDYAIANPESDRQSRTWWREVAYATPVGFRPLMLDLKLPKGIAPFPLVVFIHGGGWLSGHPNVSNPIYRKLDYVNQLLDAGFAVAHIAYRLSSEGKFPVQLHDCKSAIRFLRNRAGIFSIDDARIAVMGDSAGGHMASLVGLTNNMLDLEGEVGDRHGSSVVCAVVNWFGPTELLSMEQHSIGREFGSKDAPDSAESRLVGGSLQENSAAAIAASPMTYVSAAAPPFLIQHGTMDRLVAFQQSQTLADALHSAGCDVTLNLIEGADHCFWGVDGAPIVQQVVDFLKRVL